ncbi:MAG: LptA/OstA family protein [Candidatus Baltobacteraceae bacterium]
MRRTAGFPWLLLAVLGMTLPGTAQTSSAPPASSTPPPSSAPRVSATPRATAAAVPAAVPAPAAPPPAPGSAGAQFQNVAGFDRIQTDDVQYNLNTGEFTLKDRFSAARHGIDITADRATGNSRKKILHATGHVVLHQTEPLPNRGKATELTQKPSTLTTDQLDADGSRQLYVATGHVHFTQENREATADAATLDDLNHHLHMSGNVHVRSGEQSIDADVLDYDTFSGEVEGHGNVTIVAPVETATPGAPRPAKPAKGKKKGK